MLEVKADGDWFVYTALDMGWKFTNKIKITNKGGEIIIEDICAVKEQSTMSLFKAVFDGKCHKSFN